MSLILGGDSLEIKHLKVTSFAVLGIQGSTKDGKDFVQGLWRQLNSRFHEIKQLALKDENDTYVGLWGLMSDFEMQFQPWNDFTEGYYLAGVEVRPESVVPEGWTKWIYPGFEYIVIRVEEEYQKAMAKGLEYLKENKQKLVGAIVDFLDPQNNGQPFIYFPIKKL
jgi:predicted transcriptional regulator YdeE